MCFMIEVYRPKAAIQIEALAQVDLWSHLGAVGDGCEVIPSLPKDRVEIFKRSNVASEVVAGTKVLTCSDGELT